MANNADPDQETLSAASDLGLHCLPRPICHSVWGYYLMCRNHQFSLTSFIPESKTSEKTIVYLFEHKRKLAPIPSSYHVSKSKSDVPQITHIAILQCIQCLISCMVNYLKLKIF